MHSFTISGITPILGFPYNLLTCFAAILSWIVFNYFDQSLFFTPYFVFYIPKEGTLNFVLSSTTSILLALVLSLNIYHLRYSIATRKNKHCRISLHAIPAVFSILSSVCLGCSVYMSAFVVSLVGSIGVGVLSLLYSYNLSIRLLSLALLVYSLYFLNKSIKGDRNQLFNAAMRKTIPSDKLP